MMRIASNCAAVGVLLCLALAQVHGASPADLAVFDAPRGTWLATVRGDAALTVLEESAGWKRVRIEGWVASTSPTEGQIAPPGPGPAPRAEEPAGRGIRAGEGAVVQGVLLPPPGDPSNKPGSGLLVLLVSDLQALDAERSQAGSECHTRVAAATEAHDRLKSDYDRALNSTDNFRDAATRSDLLKVEIAAAAKARALQVEECRQRAEEIYQRFTVQRAISDNAGRFEFRDVPSGRHRVVATETAGEHPRAWSLECAVTAGRPTVLDPRKDTSSVDPFWGLR